MTPHTNDPSIPELRATSGGGAQIEVGVRSREMDELCQLVMSRHGRLRQLIRMRAPDIVVRNEGRMLQAAVGAVVEKCEAAGFAISDGAGEPLGGL